MTSCWNCLEGLYCAFYINILPCISGDDDGLSTGAKIGIAVGVVAAVAIAAVIVAVLYKTGKCTHGFNWNVHLD